MPRVPCYALIWSRDQGLYELYSRGQLLQRFAPGDDLAWQRWLTTVTSLAFHGPGGSLNLYQEARPRGGRYWYAYHTARGRTRKRYLGHTARVALAVLAETAHLLADDPAPPRASAPAAPAASAPPAPAGALEPLVLATKLAPPRLPPALVERDRLLAALDRALTTPLTLLCAGAGWGKTVLLASWARRQPQPVAWLSLDALDSDPFRFWAAVIQALRARVPGVGAQALAMLRSPHPPVAALLTVLLNELAAVTAPAPPVALLLDDYQVIGDPLIHETLTFWVEHLPAHVHLLLASRTEPDLPLPRWRARGQLVELRPTELRFDVAESARFLRQALGRTLANEEVTALERRTEGWAAGLQLAVLALRDQPDPAAGIAMLTGSHRYVRDYLQQEILARQPAPVQAFLLQVAVLTRLNAAAAQAVTGEPASQALLETLEQRNLFVEPLDEQRQWYRLPDLFREALLARLRAEQPHLLPLLHARAAHFYAAAGALREAIAHALSGPDYPLAAALLEQAAPEFWRSGESVRVQTWVLALPDAVLAAHLPLALDAALHLRLLNPIGTQPLPAGLQAQMERTRARLSAILRRPAELALPEAERTVIGRRLRLLGAVIEASAMLRRGAAAGLRELGQELDALPPDPEVRWQAIPLMLTFWEAAFFQQEGATLIPRLQQAQAGLRESGEPLLAIQGRTALALAYTRAAQWRRAREECLAGLALGEQSGVQTSVVGYLFQFLGQVAYARNELEEAAEWLQRLRRFAQDWQMLDLRVRGELLALRLALATGERATAQQALRQLDTLLAQEELAPQASWVRVGRVQCWLAEGNLAAAAAWAARLPRAPQSGPPWRKGEVLMAVQVQLAQQQYALALAVLEQWQEQLDRPGDRETAIVFLALRVVALWHAGKRAQAAQSAVRLLALTEPEGAVRVYLDLGPPMKQTLLALLPPAPWLEEPTRRALRAFRAFGAQLLAAFPIEEPRGRESPLAPAWPGLAPLPPTPRPPSAGVPAEPLTRREQEVLGLLVAGASNQEIASALVIQLSTVKKHVSSVLRKLGAARRSQARAWAQARALL